MTSIVQESVRTSSPDVAAIIAWRDHGDEAAAVWIVRHLTPLMQGIALRSLPRPWMAEDAVQMTLVKVFRSLESFDSRVPLSAWAVLLMKQVCANLLRGWRRRAVFSTAEMECEQMQDIERGDDRVSLHDTVMAREELRAVLHHIDGLATTDRLLISLMFMSDASAEDMGCHLGLSAGAVRVRACRLRSALRASLGEPSPIFSTASRRSSRTLTRSTR